MNKFIRALGWYFLGVFSMSACALTWPYKHYDIDVTGLSDPERGVLRGVKPEDDITMEKCLPTAKMKSPCYGVMAEVYLKMKDDKQECDRRLDACLNKGGG